MTVNLARPNADDPAVLVTLLLNKQDYLPQYNKKLEEQRKQASLPGFRPGKVPAGVIKKMVGSRLLFDVITEVCGTTLTGTLKENGMEAYFGPKLVEHPEEDKLLTENELKFTYRFSEVPPIQPNLDELVQGVKLYIPQADDKSTDNFIQQLREDAADVVPAQEGDEVYGVDLEFVCHDISRPISAESLTDEAKEHLFEEGAQMPLQSAILKDHQDQLISNLKLNKDEDHKVTFGKKYKRELPELDEQLYKTYPNAEGESAESEEAFKEQIAGIVEKRGVALAEQHFDIQLADKLLKEYNFKIDDEVLKQLYVQEHPRRTDPDDEALIKYGDALKLGAIYQALHKSFDLTIEDNELVKFVAQKVYGEAMQHNLQLDDAQMEKILIDIMQTPDRKAHYELELVRAQVLRHIRVNAPIAQEHLPLTEMIDKLKEHS